MDSVCSEVLEVLEVLEVMSCVPLYVLEAHFLSLQISIVAVFSVQFANRALSFNMPMVCTALRTRSQDNASSTGKQLSHHFIHRANMCANPAASLF